MKITPLTDEEIIQKIKSRSHKNMGAPICVIAENPRRLKKMAEDGLIVRMVINGEVRYSANY